jgi:hypothetical protein
MPKENYRSDKQSYATTKTNEEPQKMNWFWTKFFNAAMWTAIFTGVLSVFTYFLYRVSEQSDETAKGQARAFVSFTGFTLGPDFSDQQGKWAGKEVEINWTNNGTTPAKLVVIQVNAKPFLEDIPDSYDFPLLSTKTEGAIGQKVIYTNSVTIPSSVWDDAWHGKARLFLWGTALYRDVFPNDPDRLTEFCFEAFNITTGYTVQPTVPKGQPLPTPAVGSPGVSIAQFQWRACNRGAHSCYDEDCKDYKDRVADMRK